MKRSQNIIQNIKFARKDSSRIHGLGLFATDSIPKSKEICQLDGQIIDISVFPEAIDGEWNGLGGDQILFRFFSTYYSFLNHSKSPNLSISSKDSKIIALRDIERGEELLIDYLENGVPIKFLIDQKNIYLS